MSPIGPNRGPGPGRDESCARHPRCRIVVHRSRMAAPGLRAIVNYRCPASKYRGAPPESAGLADQMGPR
jgi:hypothetical protein